MATNCTLGCSVPERLVESLGRMLSGQLSSISRSFSSLSQSSGLDKDITNLGSAIIALLFALRFLWPIQTILREIIIQRFMASIQISSTDDIYLYILEWMAVYPQLVMSRQLTVETVNKHGEEEIDSKIVGTGRSIRGLGVYLNYANQELTRVS